MSTRLWQVTKIVLISLHVIIIALLDLLLGSLVHETAVIPARMIMEHCMLVAILTANVGTEVGAFILQQVVVKFSEEFEKLNGQTEEREERDVVIDNLLGNQTSLPSPSLRLFNYLLQ